MGCGSPEFTLRNVTIQQAFETAHAHHQAGRLAEAEAIYRQILAAEPRNADALHYLGVVAYQTGRNELAVRLMQEAVALAPGLPGFHSNLGLALFAHGRFDEAIAAYERAIALHPQYAEAYYNLGNALQGRREFAKAIAAYRQAITFKPDYPSAYDNLGTALRREGREDEAIDAHRRAIALRPQDAKAHYNLGNALQAKNHFDEAITAYQQAVRLQPELAAAHTNLGNVLKNVGRLDDAVASYRRGMALAPADATIHSNLIYALLFHSSCDAVSIREEQRRWEQKFAEPLRKFHRPHGNDRNPARRLRVGYVSADFCFHVICHFLTPLLEAHDHSEVEVYCYASVERPDAMTERLRKTADVWRDAFGVSDEALAELIREDQIDILVDLTQHMAHSRLLVFARQPAPVQVAWLGYPGSAGLTTMNYRITDAFMEPESSPWSESVEKPLRLPNSWFCFDPINDYPAPGPLPALAEGHVTFGSFTNFCKINDEVLELWAKILEAVDGARLLLKCPAGATQARVRRWFSERGIADGRLELVSWAATRAELLELFGRIDLALETSPYNGGTTTCEALWMGVPVPTFPGSSAVSRIGLSILSAAGLPELIAADQHDYVRLMTSLAHDTPRLAGLRSTLRPQMQSSAFMDAHRFARDIEQCYRQIWRSWCAQGH
jgi:predicted O-linked N-acetylglucosamine transferase (SPINDLY family)